MQISIYKHSWKWKNEIPLKRWIFVCAAAISPLYLSSHLQCISVLMRQLNSPYFVSNAIIQNGHDLSCCRQHRSAFERPPNSAYFVAEYPFPHHLVPGTSNRFDKSRRRLQILNYRIEFGFGGKLVSLWHFQCDEEQSTVYGQQHTFEHTKSYQRRRFFFFCVIDLKCDKILGFFLRKFLVFEELDLITTHWSKLRELKLEMKNLTYFSTKFFSTLVEKNIIIYCSTNLKEILIREIRRISFNFVS